MKISSLYTEEDINNLNIISQIVKEKFCLSEESFEVFKNNIYSLDFIDNSILDVFKKAGSTRVSLNIPDSVKEKADESWVDFKNTFNDFCYEYGANYSNYRKNKITIDKNEFKLKKAIEKFYIRKIRKAEGLLDNLKSVSCDQCYSILRAESTIFSHDVTNAFCNYIISKKCENDSDEITKEHEDYLLILAQKDIYYNYNKVIRNKIFKNDNSKIVMSINFADWFLCSTSESWSSCLSLNGNSANYWYGLPGLAGDPNRAMLYITNKEKKKYRGIETDRFLFRTWMLLDDTDTLNILRWFPSKIAGSEPISQSFYDEFGIDINYRQTIEERYDFASKKSLQLIYNENDDSLLPYFDYTNITEGPATFIESGDSGIYSKPKNLSMVKTCELYSSDNFITLDELYERNTNVVDAVESSPICQSCQDRISEEDTWFSPDEEAYCYECFIERFTICNECQETIYTEESIYTEDDKIICTECIGESHFCSDYSGKFFPLDDLAIISKDRYADLVMDVAMCEVSRMDDVYLYDEEYGIFYKSEYMIEDENEEFIHISRYKEQAMA